MTQMTDKGHDWKWSGDKDRPELRCKNCGVLYGKSFAQAYGEKCPKAPAAEAGEKT